MLHEGAGLGKIEQRGRIVGNRPNELGGVLPRRSRDVSDRNQQDHEGQAGTDQSRIGTPTHEASSLSAKWNFTLWEHRKQKQQITNAEIKTKALEGKDSLLSIVQMPAGVPVATVAIGKAGSINAALLAASILGLKYPKINKEILEYRKKQTKRVLKTAKLI